MARVLCAWEFGGDLGHVRRLMPIAAALRAAGHSVVLAFRDSSFLEAALGDGFPGFVAPLLRAPPTVSPSPLNFSDILLNLGFDDPAGLRGALRAWRSLYAVVKPDLLLADYAPTALVAARGMGLRRVTIGTGFSLPRSRDPLPALRSWGHTEEGVLRALDDRLVNSIRAAMQGVSPEAPRLARDIFAADAHLLCTFAQIDPFAPREGVEYVGPQGDATTGVEAHWSSAGPRVFAYLKPRDRRFGAIVAGLRALGGETIVAAPGMGAAEALAASDATVRIVPAAVSLDAILRDASLCVAHAGPGLAARALVAGVPMALLPMQLEQYLVAKRLEEGGSAAVLSPEETAPDFAAWFASVAARDDLRRAAREQAQALRGYSFDDATARAAQRIGAIASGG